MANPIAPIPGLKPRHMDSAKLYAHRHHMISAFARKGVIAPGGAIAEVGVGIGDFSLFLIDTLKPTSFAGCDLFTLHEHATMWGQPTTEMFDNLDHLSYYERKLKDRPDVVLRLEQGAQPRRPGDLPTCLVRHDLHRRRPCL